MVAYYLFQGNNGGDKKLWKTADEEVKGICKTAEVRATPPQDEPPESVVSIESTGSGQGSTDTSEEDPYPQPAQEGETG